MNQSHVNENVFFSFYRTVTIYFVKYNRVQTRVCFDSYEKKYENNKNDNNEAIDFLRFILSLVANEWHT